MRATCLAMVFAVLSAAPDVATAQSSLETANDDRWHGLVAPYLWASGMKGNVGLNGTFSVPVDASFADALENLDLGFLGRFEARKNRLGLALDVAWMNLGVDIPGPTRERVTVDADVRSLTTEGIASWRVVQDDAKGAFVDVLGGARYMKNRAGASLERDGEELFGGDRDLDWVDALAGARFRLPVSRTVAFHGRGDVAGLGSDFTWNLQGGLDVKIGTHWKTGAGYRCLDVDYDKGEGRERRIWSMTYQGPYTFVGYAW